MKKQTKIFSIIMAVMLAAILIFPHTALAANANYRTRTLKPDTWAVSFQDYYETGIRTFYKVTLDADSIVKFTFAEKGKGLEIYKSASGAYNYSENVSYIYASSTAKTEKVAMNKGTYYIRTSNKFKYSIYSTIKDAPNYSAANAVSLSKDKTVTIGMTPKNTYTRWYKITLQTAQTLHVTLRNNSRGSVGYRGFIEVYNSNMKRMNTSVSSSSTTANVVSKTYETSNSLSKGTYYIAVYDNTTILSPFIGAMYKLSWK